MQVKDIKRLVTKQLKKEFPHFRRLTKKQKKVLVEKVISEVMACYKPGQAMEYRSTS